MDVVLAATTCITRKKNKQRVFVTSSACKFRLCSYAVSSIRRWPHMDGLLDLFFMHTVTW